ncbi:MAG TPA: type VI secretion system tube protein Hcp [Actinomycetota bacterium]|nr:type VI secretion system tube protein Hcp [Actinomycetota bacterium]
MAFDAFLKIEGIKGESFDSAHKGEIDILSFSWGVTNTGSFATGSGGGTGKASFQDLHFTHKVDKASPLLMLACAQGKHIPTATLTVRKQGGKVPLEYLKVTMEDVLVSSYQSGGARSGTPAGEFSLNFAKVEYSVAPISRDGSTMGTPVLVELVNDEHPAAG